MRLHRITPFGLSEIRRSIRETGALPPSDTPTEHWWEPHPSELSVAAFAENAASWTTATQEDDARHAQQAHELLRLPRRVAADRMIWPWLASHVARGYTLARWHGNKGLNKDRVDFAIDKNAIGRLWWSAEVARVDNPRDVCTAVGMPPSDDDYVFVKAMFRNADLHQNLTYTRELTDRTKLVAILAFLHHHPMSTAKQRDLLRDVGLLFSTVLLDALEAGLPEGGYPVDPKACGEALALLERAIPQTPSKKTEASRESEVAADGNFLRSPPMQRSFFDKLLGRRRPDHKKPGNE